MYIYMYIDMYMYGADTSLEAYIYRLRGEPGVPR